MLVTDGDDDRSATESISQTVVAAVADREGVEPTELCEPIYDKIDPDALDNLFEGSDSSSRHVRAVSFKYHGYDVTVFGTGQIELSPVDEH